MDVHIHAICAGLPHLLCHMAAGIQSDGDGVAARAALHGLASS